jgi:carbonic anhydrase
MHRRQALKLFAGLAICPLCVPRSFAADAHWTYEGPDGPAKWGDLDAANRACSIGSEQSPIDIREPIRAQLAPLNITWPKNVDTIINNGHTIQVKIGDSSVLSAGAGGNYRLLQFHISIIRANISSTARVFRWRRILSKPMRRARSPSSAC